MTGRIGNTPHGFDDDRFDRLFDRHFNAVDKATAHPVRTVAVVILLNLVLFAACVGIVAFFVWLLFF